MREIEFRGKNKLTGKWVYGNLLVKKTKLSVSTLEEKLYSYKYSIQYLNKNGRYCTVEVIEDTVGQLIGIGEYGKIYEGMKLYDQYEEEECIPEYDDEECCFRLTYTSNYTERIESLDGLIPIEEGE